MRRTKKKSTPKEIDLHKLVGQGYESIWEDRHFWLCY
jgi:hypothetical protein